MSLLPHQPRTFEERRGIIRPSLERVGIDPDTIRLLGGSGLAWLDIDTRAGVPRNDSALLLFGSYDIDVSASEETRQTVEAALPKGRTCQRGSVLEIKAEGRWPRIDLLVEYWKMLEAIMEAEGVPHDPVTIDGCSTYPAATLAWLKNRRDTYRDTIQLLIGHYDGFRRGVPITQEADWQTEIDHALKCAQDPRFAAELHYHRKALPREFLELLRNGFNDPAFK